MQIKNGVLVFDADNTLWDTYDVFRLAYGALLESLEDAKLINLSEEDIDNVERLDRALVKELGKAEYGFKLLARATVSYYVERKNIADVVKDIVTKRKSSSVSETLDPIIERSHLLFNVALQRIPAMFPDTEKVFTTIRSEFSNKNISTILLTEGNREKLENIFSFYKIREKRWFDEVLVASKSAKVFLLAEKAGLRHLNPSVTRKETCFIGVGDSLERDIRYGNLAGLVTIYKPSQYLGSETPTDACEKPDYVISSLIEIIPILKKLISS